MRETADRTWPAVERAHAEAALQVTRAALAHRDPLREMVSAEGVGVLAWDTTSGTLLDADDDFLAMSGYTRAQVDAGEITWRRLTAEEDVAASERELGRAARTGSIGPYRKDLVRADGSRTPMLYAGAAMSDRTVIEYCIDASGSSQTA